LNRKRDEKGATMTAYDTEITIRLLGDQDTDSAVRLAQLDSAQPLSGRLLGASIEGRLVAAVSLDSGDSVANPFVPSAHARAMLELRARQLNGKGRRLLPHRRGRARAALPSSPPGAGGRLLALARRS
jgi:hypothetical protein